MKCCALRFYAELNDFLPEEKRQITFNHFFWGQPTIKDLIESLGVPHTEVHLILINGESVDFSRRVQDGDRITVYPVFKNIDISPLSQIRPKPLQEIRFVLDTHLGKLAAYLRMLGFDTLYRNDFSDDQLAAISVSEQRILLTRDRELLKRREITHGYFVRNNAPTAQLVEVLHRFDLFPLIKPFHRCLCCNGVLEIIPKEEIKEHLPPRVRRHFNEFRRCPNCGRLYWKGSHYENMVRFIKQIQKNTISST
jgi:uncharacterized protein with PIN domain/sulfur carrier protein ThiS